MMLYLMHPCHPPCVSSRRSLSTTAPSALQALFPCFRARACASFSLAERVALVFCLLCVNDNTTQREVHQSEENLSQLDWLFVVVSRFVCVFLLAHSVCGLRNLSILPSGPGGLACIAQRCLTNIRRRRPFNAHANLHCIAVVKSNPGGWPAMQMRVLLCDHCLLKLPKCSYTLIESIR